jgi:hypothetical protein
MILRVTRFWPRVIGSDRRNAVPLLCSAHTVPTCFGHDADECESESPRHRDHVRDEVGVWSERQHPDRDPLLSFSIATTAASAAMTELHHRIPIALPAKRGSLGWTPASAIARQPSQQHSASMQEFGYHAVSTFVSSSRHQGAQCIEPLMRFSSWLRN